MTERHVAVDQQAEILDLGCGHGTFVYVLHVMRYSDVTGVDVSSEQAQVVKHVGLSAVGEGLGTRGGS